MIKQEKGITIIALIVTIIVLLILSAITLGSIKDHNGIIVQTKERGSQAQMQSIIEKIEADLYEEKVKTGKTPNKSKLIEIITKNYGTVQGESFIINDSDYTVPLSEIAGWENKYVESGLMLHLDAINNTGEGDEKHSSTATTWKDLSGNGNDGILQNFDTNSWNANYLDFDGVNDWVKLYEMNYPNVTMEVVGELDTINPEMNFVANVEGGGYAIQSQSSKICLSTCINNAYSVLSHNENYKINKKYCLSGSYDGKIQKLYTNGNKQELLQEGEIKYPGSNTIMVLGGNPIRNECPGNYLDGKIYSVRIYDRALSEEEVMNNYEIDKARFGVE